MRCGGLSSPRRLVQRWHLWHDPSIDKLVDEISVIVQTSWQVDLRFLVNSQFSTRSAVCGYDRRQFFLSCHFNVGVALGAKPSSSRGLSSHQEALILASATQVSRPLKENLNGRWYISHGEFHSLSPATVAVLISWFKS
jgi:hypothetical protein